MQSTFFWIYTPPFLIDKSLFLKLIKVLCFLLIKGYNVINSMGMNAYL